MKRPLLIVAIVALPVLALAAPVEPVLDPVAVTHLREMSTYLSGLKTFRVHNRSIDEVITKEGQNIQYLSETQVAVKRPNRVRRERVGASSDAVFRYDGKQFSVYGKRSGYYAIAPAPPTLEEALDVARARLGLELPAGDLIVADPYRTLMEDAKVLRYIGVEPVDGVRCHHLAVQGAEVDAQLWIQEGAQPLPRRYVIRSKTVPGAPQYTVVLSSWEVNVALPDSLFNFDAPPGSRRIDFAAPRPPVSSR